MCPSVIGVFWLLTNSQVNALESDKVKKWMLVVFLFMGLLLSSLMSLKYVSVVRLMRCDLVVHLGDLLKVTLTIIRNGTTLVVAAADSIYLKQRIHLITIWTLLGILFGSIVYGWSDVNFHPVGYFWLTINVLSTSAYQVYVKKLTELKLSAFGMVYYNNLLSLPFFFVLAIATGEMAALREAQSFANLTTEGWAILVLSCLLGFCISFSGFTLNLIVTATTLMVINNVNKIVFIILSEFFYQATLTATSAVGAVIVLACSAAYSYFKLNPKELEGFESAGYKVLSVVLFILVTPFLMRTLLA